MAKEEKKMAKEEKKMAKEEKETVQEAPYDPMKDMAKEEKETVQEAPYDPMKDMVPVFLPRASAKAENFVFVGLNGKAYKIMRGTEVRVPRPVYDILRESTRLQERADDYSRAAAERAGA